MNDKKNYDRKIDNENKAYEITLETTNKDLNKEKEKEEKNNINTPKLILDSNEKETKEDSHKRQDINSIKQNKYKDNNKNNSKNNSKKKINNNILKDINTTTKKNDNNKSKEKIVTLIKDKDNQNNIRRKLIKTNHKLNIREKTKSRRAIKSNKKPSKLINYNNFKRRKQMEITPNLKNVKYNSKKLINKRINNSKILRKKYSSKGSINKQKFSYKKSVYSSNINNTIDDSDIPKKYKLHFNFHKLNLSSMNNSKRPSSVAKNNIKLNSFETSKTKNNKKNKEYIYDINSSVKKNNKNINNNNIKKYGIKFNLLHKKNLKEINRNLKNKRYNDYLKTEISEKGKNLLKLKGIKKMKLPNIDSLNNGNNTNIKIIDNTKEDNDNIDTNINKNYNIKTNVKKINNNKLFQKNNESNLKGNSEYIIRTFDKEKHDSFFKHNLNKYSKISGNLNKNYLKNIEHKNTIDLEDKIHKINIDISTNLGCIKNNNINNSNNNNEHHNSKKNNIALEKKKPIINKIDMLKKDNIYINIDVNNKKLIPKDNLNDKHYNIKEIDNIIKTEPSKKPSRSSHKNINSNEKEKDDDDNNNKYIKIKMNPTNPNKIASRKNQKINKKNNIPKNLNKSLNSSIFNSLIKNPFVQSESTNFNTINQSSNNTNTNIQQGGNNINKKINNNKNSHKIIKNSKKKPCVTIRNTVINFNMIDSGFILESLNRKKDIKKKSNIIGPNNSVNRIQNNHLYGLCNKFNSNNLIPNINNNMQGGISIKTKTINVNNHNNLHFNSKKMLNCGEKYNMKKNKKISNIRTTKFINNHDKIHMKFNSMRLEDFNGLKSKKKTLNNININKIGNLHNSKQKHFNTVSNEEIINYNENNNSNRK